MGYQDRYPQPATAGQGRVWPIPDWIFAPDGNQYSPDPDAIGWVEVPASEVPAPDPVPFGEPHPADILVKLDAGWILSQAEEAVRRRQAYDQGEDAHSDARFIPLDYAQEKRRHLHMAYEVALTPGSRSSLSPSHRYRSDEDEESTGLDEGAGRVEAAEARLLKRARRALQLLVQGKGAGLSERLENDAQVKGALRSAALRAAKPLYEGESPTLPTSDWWRKYKSGVIQDLKDGLLGEDYDARQKRKKRAGAERVPPPEDWDAAVDTDALDWALCSHPDLERRLDQRFRQEDFEQQLKSLRESLPGKDQKILATALDVVEEEGTLNLHEVSRRTSIPSSTVHFRWNQKILPLARSISLS